VSPEATTRASVPVFLQTPNSLARACHCIRDLSSTPPEGLSLFERGDIGAQSIVFFTKPLGLMLLLDMSDATPTRSWAVLVETLSFFFRTAPPTFSSLSTAQVFTCGFSGRCRIGYFKPSAVHYNLRRKESKIVVGALFLQAFVIIPLQPSQQRNARRQVQLRGVYPPR